MCSGARLNYATACCRLDQIWSDYLITNNKTENLKMSTELLEQKIMQSAAINLIYIITSTSGVALKPDNDKAARQSKY